ncbi:MAG: MBL fold metallo-hydrolase [Erysipelotrichaceae bacterium]|nr:MBL fold metallo-hydrolase [Erysipelotrichaceae bacterium]
MKAVILTDNRTIIDSYYLGEPAFSLYLECDGKKILFDTGYSDVFLRNAGKMGIDLSGLDAVVLSHGHNDHTGGLRFLTGRKLIGHPDVFEYKEDQGLSVGSPVSLKEAEERFTEVLLAKEPYRISEHLLYLGEIPRIHGFESVPVGHRIVNGQKEDDHCLDDSALVYEEEGGIFVFTGCSHSGLCNILDRAKKLTGKTRILGILGGFHLLQKDERMKKTVDYLKGEEIDTLYPCHCIGLDALYEMMKEGLPVRECGVGTTIER